MALATNSTPGSIVIAGDLAGTATSPQLRPTGVIPGTYPYTSIVVDAKGRIVGAFPSLFTNATSSVCGAVVGSETISTDGGVVTPIIANSSTYGIVKTSFSNFKIDADGAVNINTNVVRLDSGPLYTKAKGSAYGYAAANAYTPDLNERTIHSVSSTTWPAIGNPTNAQTGDSFTLITTTSAAGSSASNTYGTQVVNLGGAVVGSDNPGLPALSNVGYQRIVYTTTPGPDVATGLLSTPDAAGYSGVNVGGSKTTSSSTGLSTAASTPGYAEVVYDRAITPSTTVHGAAVSGTIQRNIGGGWVNYGFTISGATTVAGWISQFNSQLSGIAVASISGQAIRVTSAGTSGSIQIPGSMSSFNPAFHALTGANVSFYGSPVSETSPVTYTAVVTINGTARNISITSGPTLGTYDGLIAELQADIGTYADIAIVGGNLRITSKLKSSSSSVSMATGSLWSALTGFVGFTAAVSGTSARVYTATIAVNGTNRAVSVKGSDCPTWGDVMNALNTQLYSWATAGYVAGTGIQITSKSTAAGSSISISNTGTYPLFSSITSYNSILAAVKGGNYQFNIRYYVGATPSTTLVSLGTLPFTTYTSLVSALNTNLPSTVEAVLENGNIVLKTKLAGDYGVEILAAGGVPVFQSLTQFVALMSPSQGMVRYSYPTSFGSAYKFSNAAPYAQTQRLKCTVVGSSVLCTYF